MELTHEHNGFEQERIEVLKSYGVLDTEPEVSFDQLAHIASSICKTPIALISFIDINRQWFKATVGLKLQEIPRHVSACNETIRLKDSFEIRDATEAGCPYFDFMKKEGFKYYAGVPIRTHDGLNMGTLCVIDYKPRSLTKEQFRTLKIIASQIMGLLDIRRKYKLDLERLMEMSKTVYRSERHFQDIAHKAAFLAMAELSAGLIHRIRPYAINIQNACESEEYSNKGRFIHESASEISSILDSLEKFISAEKEKSMKPFDVGEALERIILHLEWKFKKFDIEVNRSIEPGLVCVGNATQIKEAFFAVIDNAIQAVEHMKIKKIDIVLREEDHKVLIEVMDSGRGVSPTIKPFIFQPFFTTKGNHNLGTGLSLAQGVVQRHSGDILLTKDYSPTTFQIIIPKP